MAVCNLFRTFNKETGNVMMFSQYAEDLNRCYVQHDSYDVIPSKFVALDINYEKFDNTKLPHLMQNMFENSCAWLRGETIGDSWDPSKWTPERSAYMFWDTLYENGLVTISTIQSTTGSWDYFPQVKYVGNIDIHSFEEKDGIGYNEIYCYIPNKAAETQYQVIYNKDNIKYLTNTKGWCEGCNEDTLNIKGVISPKLPDSVSYPYTQQFSAEYMQDYSTTSYISQELSTDSFTFNTVVVLYDVYVRDADANITTAYKNIPLAMFLTGNIIDGVVENAVKKYTNCDDAYGSGTSYGLRLCTRYTVTPNATTIANVELDIESNYAGFSQAMAAMAESQEKMNDVIETIVDQSNNINDALAQFRNSKTNVPYVVMIGEEGSQVPYWFINGKNTGVSCSGQKGNDGADGATPEIVTVSGKKIWYINGQSTGVVAEGTPGIDGQNGPWWYNGNGTPASYSTYSHIYGGKTIPCTAYDYYMDNSNGNVYQLNTTMSWVLICNLKGPKGTTGATGAKGDTGEAGASLIALNASSVYAIAETEQTAQELIYAISLRKLLDIPGKVGDTMILVGNFMSASGKEVFYAGSVFTITEVSSTLETYKAIYKGNIGVGSSEEVLVELTCNEISDWGYYNVTLYDHTAQTTQQQTLSDGGLTIFIVPYNHQYTITLPDLADYPTPPTLTYTATKLLTTRHVHHTYYADYEQVNINGLVLSSTGDDYGILEGQTVYARVDGEDAYEGSFDGEGKAVIDGIPYGVNYTLILPEIEGYTHDHSEDIYVAGVISRELLVRYQSEDLGIFGIDTLGRHYTYDTLKTGIEGGTISVDDIVAIGLNNITLQGLNRGDGKTGCGFCIGMGGTEYKRWADEGIAFNPNKLPYVDSFSAAMLKCAGGKHNTEIIKEISESAQCGKWTYDSATGTYIGGDDLRICGIPAIDYCLSQSLTFGGDTREGFLPSVTQFYYLAMNITTLQAFFDLLGKTAPDITSGDWWASCQYSDTSAVCLYDGVYWRENWEKTHSASVLVCYDF